MKYGLLFSRGWSGGPVNVPVFDAVLDPCVHHLSGIEIGGRHACKP